MVLASLLTILKKTHKKNCKRKYKIPHYKLRISEKMANFDISTSRENYM